MVNDADAELQARADKTQTDEWKKRVETVFQESVAAAKRLNIPVLIISQCTISSSSSNVKQLSDNGLDAFAASLTEPGVFHLSMKETLAPLDYPPLFADGSHLRAKGHEILALAIAKMVLEQKRSAAPGPR
jgi:lysophospholipase L1-like esterase